MSPAYRTFFGLCLVLVVLWSSIHLASAQSAPQPSGTVTMTATSAAVGVGWSWGKGTLTLLNKKQYTFTISGLDVAAVGFRQATAVGSVYYLHNVNDFSGTYVAVKAAATVGGGMEATSMRNAKGVVIELLGVGQGVDLRLAVSGMKVVLKR